MEDIITKAFFQEYYGIKRGWYIEVTNINWAADFTFELFPYPEFYKIDVVDYLYDDDKYIINSEEYESVLNCAHGDSKIVMVGEIGYYYPARVWIGEFGKIYATHDYEEDVLIFENVIKLIEYELQGREFSSIAMK